MPKLEKIVINMGVGEAVQDAKALEAAMQDLAAIAARSRPITRAKKSVANFKIREGMAIGCKVTLRGERMYDFLDKLINVGFPESGTFAACRPGRSTGGATTASASGSS